MLFVLSLVPALKQQFNELINEKIQTNRDQKLNLLFSQWHDQSQKFWIKLVENSQKHYKGIDIYYIRYIAIKKIVDCQNIHSVNPLYLLFNYASGCIEETNGNKYFIFDDSVNENKWLLKKYADIWDGIKNEIKAINGGKENDYGNDYMKMKFNSNNELPLNKPPKFHVMTIIVRSVFEGGGKLYLQVFLDGCLYRLEEWK